MLSRFPFPNTFKTDHTCHSELGFYHSSWFTAVDNCFGWTCWGNCLSILPKYLCVPLPFSFWSSQMLPPQGNGFYSPHLTHTLNPSKLPDLRATVIHTWEGTAGFMSCECGWQEWAGKRWVFQHSLTHIAPFSTSSHLAPLSFLDPFGLPICINSIPSA